jgi:hypothetical protein
MGLFAGEKWRPRQTRRKKKEEKRRKKVDVSFLIKKENKNRDPRSR